jgi:hypothetical protein
MMVFVGLAYNILSPFADDDVNATMGIAPPFP